MRILFLSGFYPPHSVGGWPLLVEDINRRLCARGHHTQVVTSTFGLTAPRRDPGVERVLHLDADLYHYRFLDGVQRRRRVAANQRALTRAIEAFAPDAISVQCMWNLSRGLPWLAERLCPGRVSYYIADHWPYTPDAHTAYWQDPGRRPGRSALKRLLRPVALRALARWQRAHALRFEHVLCVSAAMRDAVIRHTGADPRRVRVVYNGVDTERFTPRVGVRGAGTRLLYAGSLLPHKGVHTAVEALARLAVRGRANGLSLTIVGQGHPDYEATLRRSVVAHRIDAHVRFRPAVPRDDMPALLHEFDALVFPSIWEEPLAVVMQEAMASGVLVIGSDTGGTKELLVAGETGLVFRAGDPEALADQIEYLRDQWDHTTQMRERARAEIVRRFDIRRMVDELEVEFGRAGGGHSTRVGSAPRGDAALSRA